MAFSNLHYSGGRYIAARYGLYRSQVIGSPVAAGTSVTLILQPAQVQLDDGYVFEPFAPTAAINIGVGASQDTDLTPSAVSYGTAPTGYGGGPAAYITVTTTYAHGSGDPVTSYTAGLQEAINDAHANGGGTVVVDTEWYAQGGTATILAAATVPAGVFIENTYTGVGFSGDGTGAIVAAYTASGAVTLQSGTVSLGGASAQAYTLAAPTTGTQDGLTMTFVVISAHAHTLTTPANKINGAYDTVTFAAIGDSVTLRASGGVWYRVASAGTATLSEV